MKKISVNLEKIKNDKNVLYRTNILSILKGIPFQETLVKPKDEDVFIPFGQSYEEYYKDYEFIYDYIYHCYRNCSANIEFKKTNYTVKFHIPKNINEFLVKNNCVVSNFCKFALYNTNYITINRSAIRDLYIDILNVRKDYGECVSVSVKLNADEFIMYRVLRTLMGVTVICDNEMLGKYIKYYNSNLK